MCLILFAYKVHHPYHLIVAANRDEFYNRPTAPAHFWEDEPHILAGRDLTKMGTWMGVTESGRFASLTNYRDPNENTEGKRSRGELVANFLKGKNSPRQYLQEIAKERKEYPGYNVLVGDKESLYYYSNIEDRITELMPGIYGVSNHLLNTEWPKVTRGKEGLLKIVTETKEGYHKELFELLQNAEQVEDHRLPNTGVSLELERMLSPLFIKSDHYGTRSSTVLTMTNEEISFTERVYSDGNMEERHYEI